MAGGWFAENSPAETDVDDPVRATDTDGGLLTYSLSGADAGSFTIMSDTGANALGGQIQTKAKLDHEAKSTYMVTVTATDAGGFSALHRCDYHGHQRGRSPDYNGRRLGDIGAE